MENQLEIDQNFESILTLYQQLPEYEVPYHVTQKILLQTSQKLSWWQQLQDQIQAYLRRPIFVAPAFAVLLLLVGWRLSLDGLQPKVDLLAKNNLVKSLQQNGLQDVNQTLQLPKPDTPIRVKPNMGLVTLASYGDLKQDHLAEYDHLSFKELDPLVNESMASYKFQRALQLRANGDLQATVDLLAKILQEHPNYSHYPDVLTIRIDVLFRLNKNYDALKEFSYLKSFDPDRAEILAQRWLKN